MIQQLIKTKMMINNEVSNAIQLKILAKVEALQKKKHVEQKISYMKMDKNEEQEAEQLFGNISVSNKDEDLESISRSQKSDEENEMEPEGQQQSKSEKQEENRLISILKNSQLGKKIIQGKKKVSFAEQDKNYIVLGRERKWNEKLKSPRKGKFDPQEKRTLIQNLSQCLSEANLSYDEVVKSLSQDDEKIPRNLHFWTKVCSVLPDRTLVSSFKFLKRQLSTKNKGGEWTEEETSLLLQLISKVGRKWSLIAKQMHRTSQNIRDKYRLLGEQKIDPSETQTVWKFQELVLFLRYVQKYSKIPFLKEEIVEELEQSAKHDEIELKQMRQRKYNSKSFIFHNNEVVRRYIKRQFNQIKLEEINWQKISDKIQTKTIFDCRNKFVQLLQLEICGMGSKEFYEAEISKFIIGQKVKHENQIKWQKWRNEEIGSEEAKNRWMIFKRHIQGRGQKTFTELLQQISAKFNLK